MHGTLEVDIFDGFAAGDGGVGGAIGHVGTEATILDLDRFFAHWVSVKLLESTGCCAVAVFGLGVELNGSRYVDVEDEIFAR